ncbi:hypothetical protein [Rhodococcus sp. NPDC049939]|uniref:hypothetical protein n=1 Tax=Rhodococcus sp. NPDC049939 TaxID=3155511 RepID=UPI0033C59494
MRRPHGAGVLRVANRARYGLLIGPPTKAVSEHACRELKAATSWTLSRAASSSGSRAAPITAICPLLTSLPLFDLKADAYG